MYYYSVETRQFLLHFRKKKTRETGKGQSKRPVMSFVLVTKMGKHTLKGCRPSLASGNTQISK